MISHESLLWTIFAASILIMLALDLGVFHRQSKQISIKEAIIWSAVWLGIALIFNLLVFLENGEQAAVEFAAGYLVERTLSFDNLFVFLLIFSYFKVPSVHQYKVLFWGILAALAMRGIFIVAGIELISRFHWIIYLFGAFLLVSGLKIAMRKDEEEMDVGRNPILRLCNRFIPTTDGYGDGRFLTRSNGRLLATPLLVVLLVVETSDIVFAFDSVPAIFGITVNPFIVYTSNIFSILGLRALYFALAGCMEVFKYLVNGVTLVLIFIGLKMLVSGFYEIPPLLALGMIVALLAASIGLSILRPARGPSGAELRGNFK